MPTIRLFGQATPAGLTWENSPEYVLIKGYSSSYKTKVSIKDSAIEVTCSADDLTDADMPQCIVTAYELTASMLDIHGFYYGIGTSVHFDRFENTSGVTQNFSLEDAALAQLVTAFDYHSQFDQVQDMLLAEPPLRSALRDLIHALTNIDDSVINCARAVEAIRHLITPGAKAEASWRGLREALSVNREYLDPLMQSSHEPRHGNRSEPLAGQDRQEVIKRAWIIMNRYLALRIRGLSKLSAPEFPILRN